MGWLYLNNNPLQRQSAGDCTVRALSVALGWNGDWEKAYAALCVRGFQLGEMPSANEVIASLLIDNGYEEHSLMKKCKDCYTLKQFCEDHQSGEYVVCTGSHVVYVSDGNYIDSWDSGDVTPLYYFEKLRKDD